MGIKDIVEKNVKEHGSEYADKKKDGWRIISPSNAKKFLDNPYEWRVNTLEGKQTFFGNEATVIGSLVHKYIELYRARELTKDGKLPAVDRDMILSTTSDYDIKQIHSDYPMMCEAIKENYLDVYPSDVDSEQYFELALEDKKILIAGTVDEIDINNSVITDFKTCSKKPNGEPSLFASHIIQLSVYANLLLKIKGVTVDKFRIVYIQRPTKTIGSRVYIAECDANYDIASELMSDILETINIVDENPKLMDIIFRENPLSGFNNPSKENLEAFTKKNVKNFNFITQEESKVNQVKKNIFG